MYDIKLTKSAEQDLASITLAEASRIGDKLEWLAGNFEIIPHLNLHGKKWKDCFKLRVGDYRIVSQLTIYIV